MEEITGSQVGREAFDGEREKQVGFVLRCRLRSHRSVTFGETPQMTPNDEKVSKNFSLFSPRNLGRGWLPYPLDSSTPLEIPWSPSTSSMRTTMTGSSLGDLMRMGPSLVITWTRTLRQTGQWWTGWLGSSSYSAKSADPWKWVRWRGGVGGQKWGRGKGAAWWVREGKGGRGREGMIWIEGMKLFWE